MKDEYFIISDRKYDFLKQMIDKEDEAWAVPWVERTDFNDEVEIKHQDGSYFKIKYCFLKKAKMRDLEALVVYPEHNSPMIFFFDDLERVRAIKDNKLVFDYEETEKK